MAASAPITEKGRTTRARIVGAAAELVAEKGAASMSLDDVGERAPASRSQLYHYFDDKADLLRAVVDATSDAVLCGQADHLEHLDSWPAIAAWFDALVLLQEDRQARGGCPLGSLVGQLAERDPLARLALADGLDRWEAQLAAGLARMRERDELRPGADTIAAATATMAALQGGLLLTQVRRDPQQLRRALDGAWIVLRALAPPGAGPPDDGASASMAPAVPNGHSSVHPAPPPPPVRHDLAKLG